MRPEYDHPAIPDNKFWPRVPLVFRWKWLNQFVSRFKWGRRLMFKIHNSRAATRVINGYPDPLLEPTMAERRALCSAIYGEVAEVVNPLDRHDPTPLTERREIAEAMIENAIQTKHESEQDGAGAYWDEKCQAKLAEGETK